jgi:hypothetical protein
MAGVRLMEGVVTNRASAPQQRPEKPSPLTAVWQWANKAGAAIADLRTRISALESRPQARDGVSITSLLIDQDNVLMATMSNGTTLKAGRIVVQPTAIDVASIEDMVARRVEAAAAALMVREPVDISAVHQRIDSVYTALAGFRQPKDGESVTVDDVAPLIAAEVARVVGAMPKPEEPAPVVLPDFDRMISDRVSAAVAAIPPAAPGKDAELLVVQAMVAAEVAKLPRPKDGATIEEMRAAVDDTVSRAVAALPKLKDGESVTINDIAPMVRDEVSRAIRDLPAAPAPVDMALVERFVADRVAVAVAAIPPAPAGKDVDLVVLQAMVAAEVAKLPLPKDGDSVTVEDLLPTIDWVASKAVAALPEPTIDTVAIERLVEDRVAIAVAALPPASPGKDIDPVVVQAMIAAEVAKIPRPKDGESISEDAVRLMVVEAVNQIVGAWSPPQDGHTPTEEELDPLVEAAVGRALSALPKANDGVGIADVIVNGEGRLAVVLTDARRLDAGKVVPDAVEGPPGRSVKDAVVNENGALVLTMSDGETIVAGSVVGPPGKDIKGDAGRGIASLRILADDLFVTFTDGEEQKIGRVVGEPGKPGDPGKSIKGDKGSSFTFSTSYLASDIDQFRVVEMADDDGNVRRMITLD